MRTQSSFAALSLATSLMVSVAADPEALKDELPRVPPTPWEQAVNTFEVKPGFELELVAHEPLIEDPIDAVFDEDGRLFVVEMRGYSELRDSKRGRIRMLHDDDDDGLFDRATTYATGLRWPTSVTCFDGGVFIAETPDILYLKDTDGDGQADTREVVFTGFGSGKNRLNVQAIVNGLQWGPDNRLWGATSMNGGQVGAPGGSSISLNGQDFSFDPRLRDLRAENGTAQNGMSFDSRGRRYVCSNSNHLIAVMWERNWVRTNPYHRLPNPLEGIAVDGGAAPVFRLSPDEPWRIVRTRWRIAGIVGGPVEGGGRVSGYFTGASGVTIYTGDAYGPDFVDNAFTGDVGSNLVHRKVISSTFSGGLALKAERPVDESDREFIASPDNWFRPANFVNGPDGCLYVIDMAREIIEHPWSLPPGIKKHLDLNSGNDRGRIYRIKRTDFTRRLTPKLSMFSNDALAALLDHRNGWHRMNAQRLLWERADARAKEGWGDPTLRQSMRVTSMDERAKRLTSEDPWLRASALHSLNSPQDAAELFARMPNVQLAHLIGQMNDDRATHSAMSSLENINPVEGYRMLIALAEGLDKAKLKTSLKTWFQRARDHAVDESAPEATRVAAIRLLAFDASSADELIELLNQSASDALQGALIETLDKQSPDELAPSILSRWSTLSEVTRVKGIQVLLKKPARSSTLLEAIKSHAIPSAMLSPYQIGTLRNHQQLEIRALVEELFPEPLKRSPAELMKDYEKALTESGNPTKGAEIFKQRCVSCHRLGDDGQDIGPEVASFKAAGRDSLLGNVLDPNREVAPRYQAYILNMQNGDILAGIIARETPTHVTIRQPGQAETSVVRKHVVEMKSLGASLMPEGLEAGLSASEMADLLAFLTKP